MKAKAPVRSERLRMNSLEREYADQLNLMLAGGLIADWWFQPERLRIGTAAERRDAFYTPDFRVQLPDGTIEFHETKGYWQEAAKVRIRAAVTQHPYVFVAVTKAKHGWHTESFSPVGD